MNSWRYSMQTETLVEEALERDTWSAEKWKIWREEHLAFILERAATRVPYYRNYWQKQRQNGNRASWHYLENWPVLKKEEVRQEPRAFIADDVNPKKLFVEHTSGTSGTPLNLWVSRDTLQKWYALFEARWRRWYGISRRDRWGNIGGQLVVPYAQRYPPFWVWNQALRQLYLSSYHLNIENIAAYLDAIHSYKLEYLLGYASSLYAIAQMALEEGLNPPRLKLVLSNAEPLYAYQREVISKAFQCDVRDTYGQAEYICAASECTLESFHLWNEIGVLEILSDDIDEPAPLGETGRMIATSLLNPDMPLIRYELGDRGSLANRNCSCGCSLPVLASIEGRNDDLLLTPDGRKIGRLDPVFKADISIREAQIIQESLNRVLVRVVPAKGFGFEDERMIVKGLKERLGNDMQIEVQRVTDIPRTKSGKFRSVISKINR